MRTAENFIKGVSMYSRVGVPSFVINKKLGILAKEMAAISDYANRGGGFEDNPRDSLNFTPEKHYVAATDAPTGGDPAGSQAGADQVQETGSKQSAGARHGASMAVQNGFIKNEPLSFAPSSGLHCEGSSVGDCFEGAIRNSGGVRQGPAYCSDPAPGAHRAAGVDHTITIPQLQKPDEGEGQPMGSGRTFESQRRSHWVTD